MLDKYNIAKKYYKKKDYKKAYDIFLKLAEQGSLDSQVWLAGMLYYGKGVNNNISEAYHWYEIAARQNDPEALYYCAMYYLEDLKEKDNGRKYLEKAVELKYAPAMTICAYYHEYGDYGYPKDTDRAIKLYKQSCMLEEADACINLYVLMKEFNKTIELKIFIEENIGKLRFLKIIIKDNWKNCFKLFFRKSSTRI